MKPTNRHFSFFFLRWRLVTLLLLKAKQNEATLVKVSWLFRFWVHCLENFLVAVVRITLDSRSHAIQVRSRQWVRAVVSIASIKNRCNVLPSPLFMFWTALPELVDGMSNWFLYAAFFGFNYTNLVFYERRFLFVLISVPIFASFSSSSFDSRRHTCNCGFVVPYKPCQDVSTVLDIALMVACLASRD